MTRTQDCWNCEFNPIPKELSHKYTALCCGFDLSIIDFKNMPKCFECKKWKQQKKLTPLETLLTMHGTAKFLMDCDRCPFWRICLESSGSNASIEKCPLFLNFYKLFVPKKKGDEEK